MIIHGFYYNDNNETLTIEFSLSDDDDNTYRTSSLTFKEIEYYSPSLISRNDMYEIDEIFVSELLMGFFQENNYPEERLL